MLSDLSFADYSIFYVLAKMSHIVCCTLIFDLRRQTMLLLQCLRLDFDKKKVYRDKEMLEINHKNLHLRYDMLKTT